MSTSPKLYFVKVDVRAAYDTIQQDKLLQIVEAVLEEVSPSRSTGHEPRVSHTSWTTDDLLDPAVLASLARRRLVAQNLQTRGLHGR